ncbi:hypothetical protein B7486_25830 [cyanobacterium TDX16]|nr:hypothetical protein B7486_25830 [cyanobacterium TDX16]
MDSRRQVFTVPTVCLVILTIGATALAQIPTPPRGGFTVDNVIGEFQKLQLHGDPIGFRIGVGVDADLCKHYQGISRHHAADGTPYFFVTHSMNHTSSCGLLECDSDCSDDPGELLVVRMASRPKHGERMRSNKLNAFQDLSDTPPPASDTGILSIRFNNGAWPGWQHVGDGQIVDDVLVIPMEREYPGIDEAGALIFIDVRNPENPVMLKEIEFPMMIGVLAMTWDEVNNNYLICFTAGNSRSLYFYETNTEDLFDPALGLNLLGTVEIDTDVPQSVRDKWENWQNLDFIRQTADGRLFVATGDNTGGTDSGSDWIRLFEVTRSGNNFNFIYRAERHLKLDDPRMGNAAAGTGYYVSPSGQLLLYTCEHEDNGAGGSIRAGEFHSYDVSTSGATVSGRPWVELYWDVNGWADSSPNKSLMFDHIDFGRDSFLNLDDEGGWAQEADSLRWWAPAGMSIFLYAENNWTGDKIELVGDGSVHFIRDLDGSFVDDNPANLAVAGWHDRVRSISMNVIPVGPLRPWVTLTQAMTLASILNTASAPAGLTITIDAGPSQYINSLVNPNSTPILLEPRDGLVLITAP